MSVEVVEMIDCEDEFTNTELLMSGLVEVTPTTVEVPTFKPIVPTLGLAVQVPPTARIVWSDPLLFV